MDAVDQRRTSVLVLAGVGLVVGVAVAWLVTGSSEEPDLGPAAPEAEATKTSAPGNTTPVREAPV